MCREMKLIDFVFTSWKNRMLMFVFPLLVEYFRVILARGNAQKFDFYDYFIIFLPIFKRFKLQL